MFGLPVGPFGSWSVSGFFVFGFGDGPSIAIVGSCDCDLTFFFRSGCSSFDCALFYCFGFGGGFSITIVGSCDYDLTFCFRSGCSSFYCAIFLVLVYNLPLHGLHLLLPLFSLLRRQLL